MLSRWTRRPPILLAEIPKGPWGGGDGADPGSGEGGGGSGPRNPWAVPPGGRKGPNKPTALDEFLRRARGGGGRPGGGGFGGLPTAPHPRALWAIGAGALALLWILFTSVHSIGPKERGVVTYLGSYAGTLEPGVRLTLPAPFAGVRIVDVRSIRTDNFPEGSAENLTLTGDQNILDLTYSVRWDIASPRDYVFQMKEPQATVRAAAESAMRAVIAQTRLDEALGAGRTGIEQRVADLTQSILNGYNAGIRIQGVAIKQATAPASIVDAFNKVTAAQQGAVAERNRAGSYAQQVIARAQGEAASFDKTYEQYRLAPEVTRRRMYYETMEDVLARSDKTIVEAPGVTPYLSLPGARRVPDAVAAGAGQAQPAPAAAAGGAGR